MRRVVVTGMGALTAIGNDLASYWQALLNGQNGIDLLSRFDTTEYKAKLAAEIKDFDPQQYMELSEIKRSDLFLQYGMAAASQAMVDSGLEGQVDPERFGVYFGSGIGGIITISNEVEKLLNKGPKRVSPYFIPQMISNMAAGSMAIRFNAQGPCLPITTACATSTNTLGEAFRAIKNGYAEAILAGGSEAAITPVGVAGFGNMMALNQAADPNLGSLPFDKRRAGFVIGEGAGAMVLEEYEHAVQRGARIYVELCGYGTTCDAYHITAPQPESIGATKAISLAIAESGMQDERKIYINAHGTGTPLNDVAETVAIKKALGEEKAHGAIISSTKSMVGHTLGAAGALEAIAAVLALKEGLIPPTINLYEPDPECDLDYTPNHKREYAANLALSTSFGFGGHNACVAFRKVEA